MALRQRAVQLKRHASLLPRSPGSHKGVSQIGSVRHLSSRHGLGPQPFGITFIARRGHGRTTVVTATLVRTLVLSANGTGVAVTKICSLLHGGCQVQHNCCTGAVLSLTWWDAMLQVQDAQGTDVEALLGTRLEQHKELVQGELPNGLKYVILPNQVPPERFEAHLEICAGAPL